MANWSLNSITDAVYRQKFVDVPDIISEWVQPYGGLAGQDVLDFGCGEGTMAMGVALRHRAKRVVAVDTHAEIDNCIPYANAQLGLDHLPSNLELVNIDASSALDELGKFDVIYSWSVFEHVSQNLIEDCFRKIRHVLKPNGVMFLQTTPLYYSARGAHLRNHIHQPWCHLSMQQDLLYDALRNAAGAEHAHSLKHVYETLNKATAPQLINSARRAGFDIKREYITYDDEEIPSELLHVFNPDTLRTAQLVFLATHARHDQTDEMLP